MQHINNINFIGTPTIMNPNKLKPNSLAPLTISQYAHLFPKSQRFRDPNP